MGRWTQKDPVGGSLGSVNSTNPYVYADNLPNMLVDPSGRFPGFCTLSIVAATLTAVGSLLIAIGAFSLLGGASAAVAAAAKPLKQQS